MLFPPNELTCHQWSCGQPLFPAPWTQPSFLTLVQNQNGSNDAHTHTHQEHPQDWLNNNNWGSSVRSNTAKCINHLLWVPAQQTLVTQLEWEWGWSEVTCTKSKLDHANMHCRTILPLQKHMLYYFECRSCIISACNKLNSSWSKQPLTAFFLAELCTGFSYQCLHVWWMLLLLAFFPFSQYNHQLALIGYA